MIRPVTLLAFAAFIGSGLYLYQVKHQAQLVDRQIRKIQEATGVAVERVRLLRSEYELLNNPDRLAELAAAYAPELKPTLPAQWSSMAEIERRLPPASAPVIPSATPDAAAPGAPLEPVPEARSRPIPAPAQAAAVATVARGDANRGEADRVEAARATRLGIAPPITVEQPEPPIIALAPATVVTKAEPPKPAAPAPVREGRMATAAAMPADRLVHTAPASAAPFAMAHPKVPAVEPVAAVPQPRRPLAPPLPLMAARNAPPRVPAPFPRDDTAVPRPVASVAVAPARIARSAPAEPPPMVASALGMARTMLSVTPISAGGGGNPVYSQAAAR